MNLLLLLSALLSALCGTGAGVRPAQPAAVAEQRSEVRAAATRLAVRVAPLPFEKARVRSPRMVAPLIQSILRAVPLYLNRRRE